MASSKSEFEKISSVLDSFFESQRIKDALKHIYEHDISGWEKWWQIELAMHLSTLPNIGEWDMEHRFVTDKRTRIAQDAMALDIGFRLKSHSLGTWYFVELKQNNDYRRCIDNMAKDADKVFSARKRSNHGVTIRYIACAGIFLTCDHDELIEYANDRLNFDHYALAEVSDHHTLLLL